MLYVFKRRGKSNRREIPDSRAVFHYRTKTSLKKGRGRGNFTEVMIQETKKLIRFTGNRVDVV